MRRGERARLIAGGKAQAPDLIEGNCAPAAKQTSRLVEAGLLRCAVIIEEPRGGAGPQALALAYDGGGIGAVDAAAQQRVGEGQVGIERGDLAVLVDLGLELIDCGLVVLGPTVLSSPMSAAATPPPPAANAAIESVGDHPPVAIETAGREIDGDAEPHGIGIREGKRGVQGWVCR